MKMRDEVAVLMLACLCMCLLVLCLIHMPEYAEPGREEKAKTRERGLGVQM